MNEPNGSRGADLRAKVVEFLTRHPGASANDVFGALGGRRRAVLDVVRELKGEAGLLPVEPESRFPSPGYHRVPPVPPVGEPLYALAIDHRFVAGLLTASEFRQLLDLDRLVRPYARRRRRTA